MSKQSYIKRYFKTKCIPDSTHIAVELFYSKRGYNYFTGKIEESGIWLSFSPVTYGEKEGCTCESYTAFSGVKFLIKGLERMSRKQLAKVAAELHKSELIDSLVFHYEAGHQYQLVKGIESLKALV